MLDGSSPRPRRPADPADTAARAHLPPRARDWDFIGAFKLKDGKKERAVTLYYRDSDSVAQKCMERGEPSFGIYPNLFSVFAVYQDASGKWVHKEIYSAARVGFVGVKRRTPESVVIELSPRFMVFLRPGDNFEERSRWLEKANKPFTRRLTFEAGVPVLK
jgi:hypothetical protein